VNSLVADGRPASPRPAADPAAPQADHRPGEIFAQAVAGAADGSGVNVALPFSLPTTFPFFTARPRYTVRHLLPTRTADGPDVPYLYEPPSPGPSGRAGTSYGSSPEASFTAHLAQARLTEITVSVPLPAGLLDLPDLLAAFVERRVVVRLCTLENEVLLHGSEDGAITGLLRAEGIRTSRGSGDLVPDLARAAALVEDTGGSCDGMVVHPDVYWALVAAGALKEFNAAGVQVARTRMIDRGQALLGDFRAAATLIDPQRSRLALRRGTGTGGAIEAAATTGLAVHLPQHLLLVVIQ
jgi:hypothetical protein